MGQPLAGSTNPLGQFTDEVVDQGKRLTEPAKILEQILGGKPTIKPTEDTSIEQNPGSSASDNPQAALLKQQADYQKKVQVEEQKKQALIRLHQQRLNEEIQFHEEKKQKEEAEEQQSKQHEKVEQQEEIVQLEHQQDKDKVLGSVIAQNQGSKETKAWGAG